MKRLTKLYILRLVCITVDAFYLFGWLGLILLSKETVAEAGYVKPPITIGFVLGSILWIAVTIYNAILIKKEKSKENKK